MIDTDKKLICPITNSKKFLNIFLVETGQNKTLDKLESEHLNYPKLADAMLTLAASQTEANKVKDAIKTLQTLISRSPSSDAALTARERIKQLKPDKS